MDENWWLNKENLIKYRGFFASKGWLSLSVSAEYLRIMINLFNKQEEELELIKEFKNYFQNKIDKENKEYNDKDATKPNCKTHFF